MKFLFKDTDYNKTIELAKRARQIYFDIADHEGIDFDLLKEGILHFYDNKKELNAAASKASWLHQDGMEWEVLDSDEVEDLEPAFKSAKNNKKIVCLTAYSKNIAKILPKSTIFNS